MVKPGFDFSHMSADERLELAEALWDSVLGTPGEPGLDPDKALELDRSGGARREPHGHSALA
jgi:hypothetical protein